VLSFCGSEAQPLCSCPQPYPPPTSGNTLVENYLKWWAIQLIASFRVDPPRKLELISGKLLAS